MNLNVKMMGLSALMAAFLFGSAGAQGLPGSSAPADLQKDPEIAKVIAFVKAAGYQVCETEERDPEKSIPGTVRSIWAGVAKDCASYDTTQPTMINAHLYTDESMRDAAVAQFKNSPMRGVRGFGTVWPVEKRGAVAVFGPNHSEVSEALRAEWQRRHPDE